MLSIALVCDADRRVHRVAHNPHALPIAPGTPIAALFESGSQEKATRLVDAALAKQSVYDWELHLQHRDASVLLHFAAAALADGVLLVGAQSRSILGTLFGRLIRERGLASLPVPMPPAGAPDRHEELARLNNQLVAMQRELAKNNAELTRMLEDRARLAAMAAHDLRTPLQVIASSAALLPGLLRDPALPQAAMLLDVLARNTESMIVLVNDLLVAYSADIGQLQLALVPLDLEALVSKNVANNISIARQKEIELQFSASGTVPCVLGDAKRLDQVLNNLVHNAIKFSPARSRIRVQVGSSGDHAMIEVEDEGEGMDERTLAALLHGQSPASSTGTHAERGFGLGFAIIRTLLAKHGGCIEGASTPGRGTRFSLRLPVHRVAHG